jgi:TldD protein
MNFDFTWLVSKQGKNSIRIMLAVLFLFPGIYDSNAQDTLINIMADELDREMLRLQEENYPPYYIDYRVNEINSNTIESTFGSLTLSDKFTGRFLTVTVKVGDYQLDNTHSLKDGIGTDYSGFSFGTVLPLENDDDAIRQVIWRVTDLAYKNAVNSYIIIKNEIKEDSVSEIADFSKELSVNYFDSLTINPESEFNQEEWESKTKIFSGIFLRELAIIAGKARINYFTERKYFVSSEGSRITQNKTYTRLQLAGKIKADDESILPLYKSYYAFKASGLPDDEKIIEDINHMVDKLIQLKHASVAEPYTGPTILSPGAAGVFFHEIFGHRVEGHRLKSITDGQTFKNKTGSKVLPEFIDVVFDPEMEVYDGQDLFGSYKYDDQGVRATKVRIVEKGRLQRFLMSRAPLDNFSNSNGHGRAQAGMHPVSRQSNLIVYTSNPLSDKDLRKLLIKECKKQKKEYGYYFKQVIGGFTITNRYAPNVFNIIPTEVYRIYVDGRPDELVRGVDLIGTPLLMFSEISATGDKSEIFTGFCGAESGSIPVTAISPALFIKKIETQKKAEEQGQLPILPRPGLNKENRNYK